MRKQSRTPEKRGSRSLNREGSPTQALSIQRIRKFVPPAAAFLTSTLVVWSFLLPVDSVSVFNGEALCQNLFWLGASVLCASTAVIFGGYRLHVWQWTILGAALAWLVIVNYAAGFENNPRIGWNGFWQVVALGASFWCIRSNCRGPESQCALVVICLAGCIALSVHGLHQLQIGIPYEKARYQENPEAILASLGIETTPGSPGRTRFEDRLESPEPFGTFALANSLAVLLTAGLLMTVGAFATGWLRLPRDTTSDSFRTGIWSRILAFLALCLIGSCWFLTLSRAAYVGLALGIVFGVWHLARSQSRYPIGRRAWLVFGGVCLACIAAGAFWLWKYDELVITQARLSLGYRIEYWQATWQMLKEHGLFGIGLGNFQSYYPAYKLETASEEIADPHNWMLDTCVTLSVPIGTLVIAWVFRQFASTPNQSSLASAAGSESNSLDRSTSKWLFLGATIGGFTCFLFVVFLVGIDIEASMLGWLTGGALGASMRPMIKNALEAWPKLPLVSSLGMAICLLASGSWQASGLAIPFLLLIACSQPSAATPKFAESGKAKNFDLRAIGVICLPLLGLAIFVFQTWQPVNTSWSFSQQAMTASPAEKEQLLVSASRSDSLDARRAGDVAMWNLSRLATLGKYIEQADLEAAFSQMDAWLSSDRNRYANFVQAGNASLDLAGKSRNNTEVRQYALEKSIQYFSSAVARYPSSVALHAQLAAAHALKQDTDGFELEFAEAERLSAQTPHLDKKLNRQLVWLPTNVLPNLLQSADRQSVPAEPLLNWLRKEKEGGQLWNW